MSTVMQGDYVALSSDLLRLELMVQRQVLRLRAQHQLVESANRGLYIPDAHVDALLRENGRLNGHGGVVELTALIEESPPDPDSPLHRLGEQFELSPFERDLLLVALAPALDLRFETLYAYVQNDVARKRPSVDLALKLILPDPQERLAVMSLLDVDAPLRRHGLVRLAGDGPLVARFLEVDDRLVAHLLGDTALDERLRVFTHLERDPPSLPSLMLPIPLTERLLAAADYRQLAPGLLFLHGPPGVGKEAAAGGVCAALERALLAADLNAAGNAPPQETLRLLQREAVLAGALLYLLLPVEQAAQAAWLRALSRPDAPIILGATGDGHDLWPDAPFLDFHLPPPGFERRLWAWQEALGNYPLADDAKLPEVAGKFRLGERHIRQAAHYATAAAAAEERSLSAGDLHRAARARSNGALRGLAQKVEPKYGWDDIVLPRQSAELLREVYLSVKHRRQVYEEWGFDEKLALGKGVNALFYGPSGTGKTMAADILAGALGLDLYKIDLATIVSKYIGETEKNLSRIFAAAEASNAILFFDEADALFGKRSEVKDARDRYANIEVAYLLQKMEEYDGVAILATNLRGNIDDAFARRLHHAVEFPFPDAALRNSIWLHVLPAALPRSDDIDFPFLARQFELTGGNIRNVALSAAFLAAEAGRPVEMPHLIVGVARELQKMGKLPTKAAFQEYFPLVR